MKDTVKTNVLISQPNDLIRYGLSKVILDIGYEVVQAYSNLRDVLDYLIFNRYEIDIIVTDLNDSDHSKELLLNIKSNYEGIKLVIVSSAVSYREIEFCINNGISNYALASDGIDEVTLAIKRAGENKPYFSSNSVLQFVKASKESLPKNSYSLSQREIEILRLIATEFNTKEIAHKLSISESTVYSHKMNLMKKLNINSTVGLATFAIDNNIQ